jgi:5-formyltetrahydrofolate cyclo-ligase
LADEKTYLRRILSESRAAMPVALAAKLSGRIQQQLIGSSFYAKAESIVLYAAKDNEADTFLILDHALRSKRQVLFPKIISKGPTLSLVRVGDSEELRPGAFGILEPTGAEMVSPADLVRALICVPGVAFGLSGERLGRGGGSYDRFLAAANPQAVTAGLAYPFQLLDRLPQSPHDRRLGLIVTASAIHSAAESNLEPNTRLHQGGIPGCW